MKQKNMWMLIALAAIGFLVYSGGLGGVQEITTSTTYSYEGQNVKLNLESDNQYNGSSVDPTYYVYKEKPDNWGNCRVSVESGYEDMGTSSSGTYTIQEFPGTYYVRGDLSDYYCKYVEVTIPSSGDSALADYNSEPKTEKLHYVYADTISFSDYSLGTLTNSSSEQDFVVVDTDTTAENTGYFLDEIKFQEDATYAFATDSDGDGVYDEGISSITVTVSGAGQQESMDLFDSTASIDEFAGNDVATMDLDMDLGEKETLTMQFDVTCSQTSDTTVDGDEYCGEGEDFLDSVVLVDKEGTTETFDLKG